MQADVGVQFLSMYNSLLINRAHLHIAILLKHCRVHWQQPGFMMVETSEAGHEHPGFAACFSIASLY